MTDPKDQEPVGSQNSESSGSDTASPKDDSAQPVDVTSIAAAESTDGTVEATAELSSESADNPATTDITSVTESSEDLADEAGSDSKDDLPEWEPLSPEIVEDEAIRGDFMLRWAVVLLAFLLGCREISETVTLVRIRTGEYVATHGIFPPATDVFSYTAQGRSWINLGWLFDVAIAGLYGVGGAAALTLFTALAAGVTFYLLHGINRRETPTWWASVCVAVALLMVNLQFTALPQLVTLTGAAWVLHGLYSWSQSGKRSTLWCVVASLAVWSNLDPRAFIGWIILLAYLVGTAVGRKSERGDHHADASLKDLAIATAAGFFALMVHPFGWHAILSPIQLYGVEVPALAHYAGRISLPEEIQLVPLFDASVWENLNQYTIAALLIVAVAIVTSIMNVACVDVGLLMAFLTTLGLSIVCSHELGTASLIACVLASLNGQDWYRTNCRQEYSIDTVEVLWSRAGRAVTVVGFAAVAFLAISGRLMGPEGRRVGFGFAPWFAKVLEESAIELQELKAETDERIFTFRLDQSDVLLWHGVPTFVDSRVGVFSGGSEDILQIHNRTRYALRGDSQSKRSAEAAELQQPAAESAPSQPTPVAPPASQEPNQNSESREFREAVFERFQVEFVTPRMWGTAPDYSSYFDLVTSTDWNRVSLGATTAFFRRADSAAPDQPPAAVNSSRFAKVAFDECRVSSELPARLEWPRPRSGYQTFLSLPERPSSQLTKRAKHESSHLSAATAGVIPMEREDGIGLAVLALRDAVAGASENPDNSQNYAIQATVYEILDSVESTAMAQYELRVPTQQRYYQRLFAYHQALIVDPDNLKILSSLADLLVSAGRTDLGFDIVNRALAVVKKASETSDQLLQTARRLDQVRNELEPEMETVESRISYALLQDDVDRIQLATILHRSGFPGHALGLLEEDRLLVAGNPSTELLLAMLMVESGRLEEASNMFATFEQSGTSATIPLPVILMACSLDTARGDYQKASSRCSRRIAEMKQISSQAMLSTLPFTMPTPQFLGESNVWPATQTLIASRTLLDTAVEIAELQWVLAMSDIEAGKCAEAAATLKDLVTAFPESQYRPMVSVWLKAITGEEIAEEPPRPEPGILFNDDSDMVDSPEPPVGDLPEPPAGAGGEAEPENANPAEKTEPTDDSAKKSEPEPAKSDSEIGK